MPKRPPSSSSSSSTSTNTSSSSSSSSVAIELGYVADDDESKTSKRNSNPAQVSALLFHRFGSCFGRRSSWFLLLILLIFLFTFFFGFWRTTKTSSGRRWNAAPSCDQRLEEATKTLKEKLDQLTTQVDEQQKKETTLTLQLEEYKKQFQLVDKIQDDDEGKQPNRDPDVHNTVGADSPDDQFHTAVIVFTYQRAAYLQRSMTNLLKHMPTQGYAVFISQDGDDAEITKIVQGFTRKSSRIHHLMHPRNFDKGSPPKGSGESPAYYAIAQHYGWALQQVFEKSGYNFVNAILLEDDLEIAPDFFEYFHASAHLLDEDPTLMCISAWNDNGFLKGATDPMGLYRTDFFPGLGWMLTRQLWQKELRDKWPAAYWDDWIREPAQRKGRACIRPEISRTYTFGAQGSSSGQFFQKFLKQVSLNVVPIDWRKVDLSYLEQAEYDKEFDKMVNEAETISASDLDSLDCQFKNLKIVYTGKEKGFGVLAKQLNIMNDFKAHVPRTAYRNVVTIRYKTNLLFLVPDQPLYTNRGDS